MFRNQVTLVIVAATRDVLLVNSIHNSIAGRMYGLLTEREVKMAGYWPSSFLRGVRVHKLAKKRTRLISSHLDRTSLVNKGLLLWDKELFVLAGRSASSRKRKMAPSCLLRQPVAGKNLV